MRERMARAAGRARRDPSSIRLLAVTKVFPAAALGPQFFRDMRGPLPEVRLVPTGGITLENVSAFIAAGVSAVGVGTQLADPRLVSAGRWDEIRSRARAFLTLIRRARQGGAAGP